MSKDNKQTHTILDHVTFTVKEAPESQIIITGEVATDYLDLHRPKAIKAIGAKLKLDGFREGQAPEKLIVNKAGEMAILEEIAHMALIEVYPAILMKESIDAIGRPQINITKIAPGTELGFSVTTTVMPKLDLPDYKKIANTEMKKDLDVKVTEDEIEKSIDTLRRMRAQAKLDHDKMKAAKEAGKDWTPTRLEDIDEKDLPIIDDEYVKNLGDFTTVDDFMTKLKSNLAEEKTKQAKDKRRATIAENIIEKTTVDMPQIFIAHEQDKMMAQLKHEVAMSGMEFDDYLKNADKTEDQLKETWKEEALNRAKMQLVLNHIATAEKISPEESEIEEQTNRLMEMYGEQADQGRALAYVSQLLTNQKVMEWLESQ